MDCVLLNHTEIDKIYPDLHKKVFNTEPRMSPSEVLVVGDLDDPIGYIAGSFTNDGSFYIQDSGIIPNRRKKGWLRYFNVLMNYFKDVKVFCETHNDNIASMKTLLNAGFIPIGCSTGRDGVFLIKWMKE